MQLQKKSVCNKASVSKQKEAISSNDVYSMFLAPFNLVFHFQVLLQLCEWVSKVHINFHLNVYLKNIQHNVFEVISNKKIWLMGPLKFHVMKRNRLTLREKICISNSVFVAAFWHATGFYERCHFWGTGHLDVVTHTKSSEGTFGRPHVMCPQEKNKTIFSSCFVVCQDTQSLLMNIS